MIESSVGREIKQAVQHTQLIFREVSSFLRDVDAELSDLGVGSVSGFEVMFDDLTRSVQSPTGWFQAAVGRLYGPGRQVGPSQRVLFLEVHLAPALFDHAVLVFGAADAGKPLDPIPFTSAYNKNGWALSLFAAAPEFGMEAAWGASRSPTVFAGVPDLRAVVLPLDAMTDRIAIRKELVERGRRWLRET